MTEPRWDRLDKIPYPCPDPGQDLLDDTSIEIAARLFGCPPESITVQEGSGPAAECRIGLWNRLVSVIVRAPAFWRKR